MDNTRILCPVVGCLDASASSSRFFRDFPSIKSHLDDHFTGQRIGAVPIEFLNKYEYSQCSICDKTVHKRFNGSHPKCRPKLRLQAQIINNRTKGTIMNYHNCLLIYQLYPISINYMCQQ